MIRRSEATITAQCAPLLLTAVRFVHLLPPLQVLHGGFNQKFTGRPKPKGSRDVWAEDRASGNVFYSSEDNLLNMKRKEFDDDDRKGQVTPFGRAIISILLHPLELISVRQVTSDKDTYSSFIKSAKAIYSETPGGSYMGFFAGWRR